MNSTYSLYLRDLIGQLRDEAFSAAEESRKAPVSDSFDAGRAMAYVEVLDRIKNQAIAFQIPLAELDLEDFEPHSLLKP